MKKIKYTIAIVLFVSILSAGFAFTPHRIEPVDTRADGMGGVHFTDSESFYTLFSNPAGLAFAGKKTMVLPLISMGVGAPLEEMVDIVMKVYKGNLSLDDMTAFLEDPAVKNLVNNMGSGLSLNLRLGGPLTFGAIRNNFGWGLVNTISVDAKVTNTMFTDIVAGFDLGLVFGYAIPLDLGFLGKLSIGFSARGSAQAQVGIGGDIGTLVNSLDIATIPLNATFGFGFDMAAQYKFLNLIEVAVVWQDVYSPTWTKTFSNYEKAMAWEGSPFETSTIESKLGVGIGVDIPLELITFNIISHFGVYVDYDDLFFLFSEEKGIARNPVLGLSAGAELVLFDVFAFRVGIKEMYPSAGLGIYMGGFRLDFSVYGRERGSEPGEMPELNAGLAMSIQF